MTDHIGAIACLLIAATICVWSLARYLRARSWERHVASALGVRSLDLDAFTDREAVRVLTGDPRQYDFHDWSSALEWANRAAWTRRTVLMVRRAQSEPGWLADLETIRTLPEVCS